MPLRRLRPEPWGDRLARARHEAELNVRQVEEVLFPHITKSSLIRLERLEEVPTDRRSRTRAALVLLLYGFELEGFGVDADDLPPLLDMAALSRLRARLLTRWELSSSALAA
jgi:hypothetical protein